MLVPRRFPGGIADAQGQRAALRDREGRLVAVALDAGTLLWRSGAPLEPLLLPPGEVIACTKGASPACVALAWAGERAGEPVWTSQPIALPGVPEPDLELAAEADDTGTITLHWHAAARYRGGAAPGPAVLAAARGETGAVQVDRRSGRVVAVAAPPTRSHDAGEPTAADASPDALASADIGTRRFELCVQDQPDGRVRTVLRAHEHGAGHALWELTIDDLPRTRPRALRP